MQPACLYYETRRGRLCFVGDRDNLTGLNDFLLHVVCLPAKELLPVSPVSLFPHRTLCLEHPPSFSSCAHLAQRSGN